MRYDIHMSKICSKNFGPVFKKLRESRGFSQERVSERVGVSPAFICMVESSVKFPNLEMLFRLSAAIEVRPSALVAEMENRLK